ncbi:MAG: 2OG-Fe(II) oxygenase [Gemmataceae bacterium]
MDRTNMLADLCDPDKGYVCIRNMYTMAEVEHYRAECARFLLTGPRYETRINTNSIPDYVQARSHDQVVRTFRIYQFLHNRHTPETTNFFDKVLTLRNDLESTWLGDDLYRQERERLQNYIIVTHYVENTGMLPRHQDYRGCAPHPLLQCLVLLAEPGQDFEGGDFVLHTKSGRTVSLAKDLNIQRGDLFLFDKSLFHHVELTKRGRGRNRGRWSVLIGARAARDSRIQSLYKRWRYGPLLRAARRIRKRSVASIHG